MKSLSNKLKNKLINLPDNQNYLEVEILPNIKLIFVNKKVTNYIDIFGNEQQQITYNILIESNNEIVTEIEDFVIN